MFRNMSIKKKLILGFVLIAVLAGTSSVFSMFMIHNMNSKYSFALRYYGFSQGDIGKAMAMVSNSQKYIRDLISFTDEQDIENTKREMDEDANQYDTYCERVKKTLVTDEEEAQYVIIENALNKYRAKRDEVLKMGSTASSTKDQDALEITVTELDPLYNSLYTEWTKLMAMNVETGEALSEDLMSKGIRIMIFSFLLTLVSIVVSVALGIRISHGVSDPIQSCVSRLVQLEKGDIDSPVPAARSGDETGVLLSALKNTVEYLSVMVHDTGFLLGEMAAGNYNVKTKAEDKYIGGFQAILSSLYQLNHDMSTILGLINQSADQVADNADQVSTGAVNLAKGATEQAATAEELAVTINSISDQVTENSENSQAVYEQTYEAGKQVFSCNNRMQELSAAMDEISMRSDEISKIIKLIENIAFQTNIIALNASVEAARMGESGNGFGAIANEIRNLADQSAGASKNTTKLIKNSMEAVAKGRKLVRETEESMKNVGERTTHIISAIQRISEATANQAAAIEQITEGVNQISGVIQTNSATAEESAAASEELSGQAQVLKELASRFQLKSAGR